MTKIEKIEKTEKEIKQEKEIYINLAYTFIRTVEILKENQKAFVKNNNGVAELSKDFKLLQIPIIVNSSFACELLIKSLISNAPHKHDLTILFNQSSLSDALKEEIKNSTIKEMKKNFNLDYNENTFNNDLEENKLNFIKWRYLDKKDSPIKANYQFIDTFLNVLKDIATKEYKDNKTKEDKQL